MSPEQKAEREKRTERVAVFVTEEEHQVLRRLAFERETSMSDLIAEGELVRLRKGQG